MAGFLVTGTDTGVGKTYVACGIIRALKRMGVRVHPFKPVETGCSSVPEDALALAEAAGVSPEDVVAYTFREPLAPAVAERLEGGKIDVMRIISRFRELEGSSDVVLVEGAGGLLVPITGSFTYADLAALLGIPVLVVARSRLGTINHTLLTLRVLRAYGLRELGVVVNGYRGEDTAERTNPEVIRELGHCRVFVVPHGEPSVELFEVAGAVNAYLGSFKA